MDAIESFIVGLPKVELHVHLVGSALPGTVAALAARRPGSPVPSDPDLLADYFSFRDFAHFIEVYATVNDLLTDEEDFRLLTHDLGRELARQHVRYAEVTVTPAMHMRRGVPVLAVLAGIEEGRREVAEQFGVQLRWCFDIPGEFGVDAGLETARVALTHRPDALVSFGLGGPEVGVPRAQFRDSFLIARVAGLHSVPHAGETTGPESVWSALYDLGAERIGHGTSAVADPGLVGYLRDHRIALEVCPTSNLRTGVVTGLDSHPVRQMLDEHLLVTINSDDPPMFGTDLTAEYVAVARLLDLSTGQIAALARNGVEASFADAPTKARVTAEIDRYARAHRAPA